MKHALRILMNNFTIEETSFLYKLSEEGYFDFPAFWDYYNSVRDIIRQTLDKPLDREISRAIVFTHSKILEHIIWDYSDQDIYHIQNLPYDKLHDVLERLGFLVDGYLQGFLIDEQTFGPDLQNPLLAKEETAIQQPLIHLGFFKAGLDLLAVGFKNDDGTYDITLNEADDRFLSDSQVSRGDVQGTFLLSASDSSTAYRVFHEWVMKTYSPYSSNNNTPGGIEK